MVLLRAPEKEAAQIIRRRHTMADLIRNRLRDAVFGTQDGLISTLGALTGIAEGTRDRTAVVIAGLVIVTVESLSMAAGSYLSSKSHREYLERLLREEREAIRKNPEEEREELRAMYRIRGYTDPEITLIEKRLFSDDRLLLEDMAHKELGICPQSLDEPVGNALVMGVAYILGGLVPTVPYFVFPIPRAMPISILCTTLCLFALGGAKGWVVRQSWWRSGLEMLAVAGLAAAVGFLIGSCFK